MNKLALILSIALSMPVCAETIDVKGRRGPLDLSRTELVQQECRPSLCIGDVYYDSENKYLVFDARGAFYHRCGVPEEVVDEWVNSNNLKRYYERHIKDDYDCAGKVLPY